MPKASAVKPVKESVPAKGTKARSKVEGDTDGQEASPHWLRETIESFVVALVLAFLFRAFVAEAFVIPTGSMAPTLMGAHKDVTCSECGFDYQCGASEEFDATTGRKKGVFVKAVNCPNCRFQMELDPKNVPNHATFSGDRILVSKYAYTMSQPNRWDVIVFKYPNDARLNYIKRLTGRPNETIRIQHGDVYAASNTPSNAVAPPPFEIARKPRSVVQAMLQPVHDTKALAKSLIKAGLPSPWQPFVPGMAAYCPSLAEGPTSSSSSFLPANPSWKVEQSESSWSASLDARTTSVSSEAWQPKQLEWLRYYHKVVDPRGWESVKQNGAFPVPIHPYSSKLITDYTHYNDSDITRAPEVHSDGMHWVGDLAAEFELTIEEGQGSLMMDLVEMGVHHTCQIETATGIATLRNFKKDQLVEAFEDSKGLIHATSTAQTPVRGAGRYRLKFANVDDQLTLWVGGRLQTFTPDDRVQSGRYITLAEQYPHWSSNDPLDAAPVGLAALGIKARVQRARVWRDVYYLSQTPKYKSFSDYKDFEQSLKNGFSWEETVRLLQSGSGTPSTVLRNALYSTPSKWGHVPAFSDRLSSEFVTQDRQYFPMGDNSRASADARSWSDGAPGFVPEELLLGRAISVFWPHYWNRPIPFLPNIQRMGLIR
jgi:signal peptidase I